MDGGGSDEVRASVVIVGAGPAGLATAACLARAGIDYVLLEQATELASSWRRHYERLHLHTPKGISALPYLAYPRSTPRYPSRDDVIGYLERYATELALRPRLGEAVRAVTPDPDGGWTVQSARARYRCAHVVIATGLARVPRQPDWQGREGYRGEVVHSGHYRNGARWRERRVLVVGIGNSGGEIALDLLEHGAAPTISVRGPINVIPRDVFGIPILAVGAALRVLPRRLGDLLGQPVVRLGVGDIERLGLRRLPYGALTQVDLHGRVPLIDSGTIAQIRAGKIKVRGPLERFTPDGVRFADGSEEPFDAVVAATGYEPALSDTLSSVAEACGPTGLRGDDDITPLPGLHLCGFRISTRGMLNQIGQDARAVARRLSA